MEDTKKCKDKDNKLEPQHPHLLSFRTDLAILPRSHTSMLNLVVDNFAPYINVSKI
jgi:hypothetical protein